MTNIAVHISIEGICSPKLPVAIPLPAFSALMHIAGRSVDWVILEELLVTMTKARRVRTMGHEYFCFY